MNYMGSKRKFSKNIPPIINKYIKDNNITTFVDLCCGGANLTDKIVCENVFAVDLSPSLIGLHKQAQKDFSKIPLDGNREMWDNSYNAWKRMKKILEEKSFCDFNEEDFKEIGMPLYEIGCMEWYASFSTRGFPGGYAKNIKDKNFYKASYKAHKLQSELNTYKNIHFLVDDYFHAFNQFMNDKDIVFYIDPPYKNTKEYGISKNFDYDRFYNFLKTTSCPIFVSEQFLPSDFDNNIIWKKEVRRTVGSDNNYKATETLWLIENNKEKINNESD